MNYVYLSIYRQEGGEMYLLKAVRVMEDNDVSIAEWVLRYLDTNYIRTVSLMGNVNWIDNGRYISFCISTEVVTVRDCDDELLICAEGEV
jgi:hypothetical protein